LQRRFNIRGRRAEGHANITAANVEIVLGAGELVIREGESPLMSGIFTSRTGTATSSDQKWQPEIHYTPSGSQGILTVHQPKPSGGDTNILHNSWDITLGREIPMDLMVVLGAGESVLEVGALNLSSLEVETGAGRTVVDLVRTKRDLDVTINGGVGEIILRIPRDIGVKIDAKEGTGKLNAAGLVRNDYTYTNALFEQSESTIRIAIDQAIGEITVEQMG
jgi:hypothetical protein